MRLPLTFCLFALVLGLLSAAPATAHVRSESHSVWDIDGPDLDLVITLAETDVVLLSKGGERVTDETLRTYLTERIYPLADGKRCALVPPVVTLSATAGFRKFDFTFRCDSAHDLEIKSSAFFELIPSHVNFAQIQNVASGAFTEKLITNEVQVVKVSGESEQLSQAGFLDFMHMGVMHIFTGVDHMAFLVGLVLISRRLRDLVFVVTGFTIGHSATLALAVTGVLRPHAEYIDALVALTIALIGAENIAVAIRKPNIVAAAVGGTLGLMVLLRVLGIGDLPLFLLLGAGLFSGSYLILSGNLTEAGRLRLLITLIFGLIHGFGFAANLLEMQLPPDRLLELLVGFNLGVEVGQLTLVLSLTALAALAMRLKVAPPRPIVVDVASSVLVAMGMFWFIQRSFG